MENSGKHFVSCGNNGIWAFMTAEDYKKYETVMASGGDPTKAGIKIFTFANPIGTERDFCVTGTKEDVVWLLAKSGNSLGTTEPGSFFVPFSEKEIKNDEMEYRTTLSDVIRTFFC